MKTSKEHKEERGQFWNEMNTILQLATKESRELTPEEVKKYDELKGKMDAADELIKRAEQIEEEQRRQAARSIAQTQHEKEDKQVREYSFAKAIRSKLGEGEKLDGFELEMHQEAVKEANAAGRSISGIGVPSMIISPERRTILAGTETELIPVNKQGFIDMLMAKLVLRDMGVKFMTGLTGNFQMPRGTAGATAGWKAENAESDESTPTFDEITMTPKKLTTWTRYSKQMLLQSVIAIESYVKQKLIDATALEVDRAGINGSGSAPEPRGILNLSGIGSVPMGDNGDVPTYETILRLMKEVEIDNADMGSLGFLTNPYVKAKLMATKTDAGSGLFVWPIGSPSLAGFKTGITTQVPSNLTKGTGSALSALIYGNFSSFLVGQWGGIDLIVDPYTLATYDYVRVIIHSYWDMACEHVESFSASKDIVTTL